MNTTLLDAAQVGVASAFRSVIDQNAVQMLKCESVRRVFEGRLQDALGIHGMLVSSVSYLSENIQVRVSAMYDGRPTTVTLSVSAAEISRLLFK